MLLEKLIHEFSIPNSFTQQELALFDTFFEKIDLKKNEFLIQEGEIERYSYFISEGLLRCWVLDQKGRAHTFWFCKKGTFSMSNISFTLVQKTNFNVQAVMNSELYRIDKEKTTVLYQRIPSLKPVFEDLTALLLNRLLDRQVHMIKYSPEESYIQMEKEFGSLFNQIPLKDVASYLGITPQALSRIRKRIF